MRLRWSAVLALTVALCLMTGIAMAAAQSRTLSFAGEVRSYWLYAPAGLAAAGKLPVLLVLHGNAGDGEDMMVVTQRGFEKIADMEKMLVVYPNALQRRWNEQAGSVDDAGFLLAVIDQLAMEWPVDRNRIYIAGISSGGMMAQRMACEHADRFAAVATVAGSMPTGLRKTCKPARPLSILLIHGTDDPIVPWNGGSVAGVEEFGSVLPIRETSAFWAAVDRCSGSAVVVPEPDRDLRDGTRAQLEIFATCADGAKVVLVTVQGGGHTWPGGFQYLPERFIGKTSRDIDANRVIWEFFRNRKD